MFDYVHLKNFKNFGDVEFNLCDKHGNPKKLILIYGENGIGKSNLASAFLMLADTLRTMDVHDVLEELLAKDKFDDSAKYESLYKSFIKQKYRDLETIIQSNKMIASDSPMILEFRFSINGNHGCYIIETNEEQVIHEHLEYLLIKNKSTYFDITPQKISISSKIFKDNTSRKFITESCNKFWGKHTLLSIIIHESQDKSDNYIQNQISDNFRDVLFELTCMSCKVKFGSYQEIGGLALPHAILHNYQFGRIQIKDENILDHTEKMLNAFFKYIYKDKVSAYYKRTNKDDYIKYELMLTKLIEGKFRNIEFSMESTGTQSLIQLLPYMLVSIYGATTVIDEFDTGVHDLLVEALIKAIFTDLSGQLIMTTHNTRLMESDIPKECLYVINEMENGKREIQTLTHYDPKIHENTNIRKQYLEGKYNGVPKKSDINFNNLLKELGL